MNHGDFPDCSIAGCNARSFVPIWVGLNKLGICEKHADTIWHFVEWRDARRRHENIPGMESRDYERAEARRVRSIERRKPAAVGEIYYVKSDGLIKVGWTSQLADRMRAYGPKAELLANYPGTRADEAALHRQLTPSRFRGREWYSDTPIIRDFIAKAIEKHGPPRFNSLIWTEPKTVAAGKRAGRR